MYVFLRINLSTLLDILSSTDNGSNITAMMRFLPFSTHSFLAICSSNSHQALFKKFLLRTMMVFRLDSIAFRIFSSIASPGMKSRSCMQSLKRGWSIVSTSPSLMSIFSCNSLRSNFDHLCGMKQKRRIHILCRFLEVPGKLSCW